MFFRRNINRLTDEELLDAYKKTGHTEYFGALYNRYMPLLYGVCLKYLQHTQDAQDAVMQLFEYLLPRVSDYEIGVFRTWLHSVVRNHCLQILRKEKRGMTVELRADLMESDEIGYLLEKEEPESERMDALRQCMAKLPNEQRTCLTLFFIDKLSYADIVATTGYTLSRVKSYIQNGKRNLKICIEKQLRCE